MSFKKIIFAISDHPFITGLAVSFILGAFGVKGFSTNWVVGVIVAVIFYIPLNMYSNKIKDLDKGDLL